MPGRNVSRHISYVQNVCDGVRSLLGRRLDIHGVLLVPGFVSLCALEPRRDAFFQKAARFPSIFVSDSYLGDYLVGERVLIPWIQETVKLVSSPVNNTASLDVHQQREQEGSPSVDENSLGEG